MSGLPNIRTFSDLGSPVSLLTILAPRRGWQPLDLKLLWRYRELMGFLALRDIQVRYKQTVLGVLWAVIQPVAMMVMITALRRIMGRDGDNDLVFVFAGVLPWTFFAASVTGSTNSLVANAHMLRKIYFPRLILPLAAVGAPLLDYAICFGLLVILIWWFSVAVTWQLLLLPILVVTTIVAALGVGVLLSAMTVAYRDFRYVVTLLVQIWFFATPVIYSINEVPSQHQWLLWLNPMGGTIAAFRAAVLGTPIDFQAWTVSAMVAALCLIVGLIYFSRAERRFADIV